MKAGYTISAAGHAVLLVWGLVSFSARPLNAPHADPIVADVITDTELSQITAGATTAKQTPTPTPVVDKVGEVRQPPPKDPTLKVADSKQEVVTSTAPPPAPPEPKPDPKPDPTPVEAKKADAPAPTPAAAQPPAPDPVAEALAREEAKQKEEAKKAEEARKREEAKKAREAKKREEAKKRQELKNDLSRIDTALLDKRAPQRQAVTGTIVNPTPSLGTTTGTASHLSQNEQARLLAVLKAQLRECWNPPVGVLEAKDLVVTVDFSLNRDGSLSGRPQVKNWSGNPMFSVAAESAIKAVMTCAPIRLPAAQYEFWQDVEIDFDPRQMFGG